MKTRGSTGFTLVEVLMVLVMMGIVVTAIYSLYESTQRTAATEERVVEVQQNLRVAMDQLARDIRMAGFLVPTELAPITQAPASPLPGTPLILRTASAAGYVARVSQAVSFANSNQADFFVADAEMVDLFKSSTSTDGDWVRVIRAPDRSQPVDGPFQVLSKSRTERRLTLQAGASVTAEYVPGDLIVRTTEFSPHPMTISYTLDQGARILRRTVNNENNDVASDIFTCTLSYIMEDGTEITDPSARLREIRAIRVVLGGQASLPGGEEKLRTFTSVIPIKNP